jgi:cytochrome bd ubiquinol oxidase subunit I
LIVCFLPYGNPARSVIGAQQRMVAGRLAVAALDSYKTAKQSGDTATAASALAVFNQYKDDLGYGYLTNPEEAARTTR